MQHYLQSLALDVFRLSVWLMLLAVIFIPLERLFTLQKQPVFRKEFVTDLGYFFFNSLISKLLLVIPISIIAWGIHNFEIDTLYIWMANLPIQTRLVLAMFVGEFGVYWGHRWSHELPLLWRFHAIHHSAQRMDWLVNSRSHPFDALFVRLCGLFPIYLLGLAQPTAATVDTVPILYTLVGTIWSFLIHANISWRFGFLERLVATPAFHHWHHTNDGAEYINKNYATIFPVMDILFGSFYLPKQRWPQRYGIDTPMAASFVGQLMQPLAGKLAIIATRTDRQSSK
jgi:sterol desaturase/sphingolipid hydroxylase (fatty acid hydroxylase superfamily)